METLTYWYWNDILNQDQIKQINLICEKYHDPFFEDGPAKNVVKTADVRHIKWELLKPVIQHVDDQWRDSNKFNFGFNLFQTLDIDLWNINTYDSKNKGEYDFHTDATNDYVNSIKFTGIVNISDEPYEGGEFIAFYDNTFKEIPEIKNPGSSILLRHGTLHKVKPVTKGIRKTLSYWLYGPRFI
jgi:predicted 2-oxoglutarate/Fe(II)-dependent dioxygenase YbiX